MIRDECKRSAPRYSKVCAAGTPKRVIFFTAILKRFQAIPSDFKPPRFQADFNARLSAGLGGLILAYAS
jgi:hypothetical protein